MVIVINNNNSSTYKICDNYFNDLIVYKTHIQYLKYIFYFINNLSYE